MSPKSNMTVVYIKREKFGLRDINTEGRMSHEDRGRDWSGIPASQGMPRISSKDQKLGEKHRFSFRDFRRNQSC